MLKEKHWVNGARLVWILTEIKKSKAFTEETVETGESLTGGRGKQCLKERRK